MDEQKLQEIKKRLYDARPRYKIISASMGSGSHLCTAIVAEDETTGHKDFIVDIFPDYVVDNIGEVYPQYLDIGFDGHHARMKFFQSVFDDMDYLLSCLEQ